MTDELHPIVAQMSPSLQQRPAIIARGADVAVTAGAGTGKTRTLVARYLSLLLDDLPLRSIVAITFTKKAAREMRNRVREEVRRYLDSGALDGRARQHWRAVYDALDAARIGTIHSLCSELLRHHPAEAGIDPRFDTLDEAQAALLQAQAVEAALAWAADDARAVRLFADFGVDDLRQSLAGMLSKRLDVAEARDRLGADVWPAWEARLVRPLRAFVEDAAVQAEFAGLLAVRANGTLARAESAGDALAPQLRETLRLWDEIAAARAAGDWAGVSARLAPLRDTLKQKGRKGNWAPADPKAAIKALQVHYDEQLADYVGQGLDLALDRELATAILPELLRLYDRALTFYNEARAARQALDFDDLEAGALALLREHPAVAATWQQEVLALLVDEFQDTNARQRDLLDLLDGGAGKRFIVGDGKQSIYRFRGADVTVFREERQTIAGRGAAYALATSYRAHRALIAGLNALLAPVLGAEEDPARPYIEPFAALAHHRETPAAGLHPPFIELHLGAGSKTGGALDKAADALAARLVALVEGAGITLEGRDPDTGQRCARPLDYGDVAILCRASSAFSTYENALERAGIPFLTVAGRGFYERPEVRDVLNALRALDDPTDDLTLAGLLRSPACGLSDLALYRLVQARDERGAASLWAALGEGALDFLGAEVELAAEAVALIRHLHAQVGRVTVAEVLKRFLDATGYPAALLRAGQARGAGNLSKLLADAHASEIVGVGEFLDYVAQLRDAGTRESEAHTLSQGAVQLMTVHAAKGLEFPVVVIGEASKREPRSGGVLVDEDLGIVPPFADDTGKAKSAAYQWAKGEAGAQEAAESDRLLYVAATRAQELLLLSGVVGTKKAGVSLAGWLNRLDGALRLSELAPVCDAEGDVIHRVALRVGDQPVACALYEGNASVGAHATARAVPVTRLPESLPMLTALEPEPACDDADTAEAQRDPPRRVWRVVPEGDRPWAPAWVVGKLVHGALEHWLFPGAAGFARWAEAEARGCGIADDAELRDAIRRAERMLVRFQATALCAAMDAAVQRLHEVSYTLATEEGAVARGVIDALYRTEAGWTLVEFKSDRVGAGAALERHLAETDYVAQVGRYLDAAERLLGARPHPVLCFLDCGGAVRWIEDRWG